MNKTRRAFVLAMPLLAVASMLVVGAARPSAATRRLDVESAKASQWAKAHRASLPTSLTAISKYPMVYRKAIYGEMALKQKEGFWRDQLGGFLLPAELRSPAQEQMVRALQMPLTDQQRAMIRLALDSLSQLFGPGMDDQQRQELANRLCGYKKTVFDPHDAATVFVTMGPADSEYIRLRLSDAAGPRQASLLGVAVTRLVRRLGAKLGLIRLGDCYCAQQSICDCPGNIFCSNPECTPIEKSYNCGCLGTSLCNGDCW